MGEKVEFKSDGNLATGYLARPARPGPGLIVQAQHAFFNDTRAEVYDHTAADDAWTRTLAFFRAELKS